MKPWITYALISMLFAGVTSVIAKLGLTGISGELGLAVRTCFVFLIIMVFAMLTIPVGQISGLGRGHYFWLGLSGLTTAVSWLFYYKAIKEGDVSTVAIIDKGSVLIAVLLAAIVLKEQITLRTMSGAALIIAGLFLVARR